MAFVLSANSESAPSLGTHLVTVAPHVEMLLLTSSSGEGMVHPLASHYFENVATLTRKIIKGDIHGGQSADKLTLRSAFHS